MKQGYDLATTIMGTSSAMAASGSRLGSNAASHPVSLFAGESSAIACGVSPRSSQAEIQARYGRCAENRLHSVSFNAKMGNPSDLVLQEHRIYVLRTFELQSSGNIVCSGFARSNPEKVIAARFPKATIVSSWQEVEDTSKLPWPLEVVSFHAVKLAGKRFRFSLDCIDFQREWESEWPELL